MKKYKIQYQTSKTSPWLEETDSTPRSRALCAGLAAVMKSYGGVYDVKIKPDPE